MGEQLLDVAGTTICAETFGDPSDPTVLLIAGAASSMDYWDERLCRRLSGGGRHVVRYDHRDTGRSSYWPPGRPGYEGPDLIADALGVLNALGVDAAHAVGISMGGGIAQCLAVEHPGRVRTLTLMSTSPGGPGGPGLPPMSPELAAAFATPDPDPDWSDDDAVAAHLLAGERLFAGSGTLDEARARTIIARSIARTTSMASAQTNHWTLSGGEDPRPRLGELRLPTLVVHGDSDPFFPIGHAHAFLREIRGSRLLVLPDVGHQAPPERTWEVVVPALLAHTDGGRLVR